MNIIKKTYLDNLTDTFCGRRDMTRRFSNQCLGEVLSVNIERLNGRKNPSPLVVLVMHGLYINLDLSCNQTCVHIKFIVNERSNLAEDRLFLVYFIVQSSTSVSAKPAALVPAHHLAVDQGTILQSDLCGPLCAALAMNQRQPGLTVSDRHALD